MNNEKEIWDTEHEHLKHFSRSSYEERLNWLEEANEFVRESQIAYSKKRTKNKTAQNQKKQN